MKLLMYVHGHDRSRARRKAEEMTNKSGSCTAAYLWSQVPQKTEPTVEVPFRASGFANVTFAYLRPFWGVGVELLTPSQADCLARKERIESIQHGEGTPRLTSNRAGRNQIDPELSRTEGRPLRRSDYVTQYFSRED